MISGFASVPRGVETHVQRMRQDLGVEYQYLGRDLLYHSRAPRKTSFRLLGTHFDMEGCLRSAVNDRYKNQTVALALQAVLPGDSEKT